MDVVKTFGRAVTAEARRSPARARWLLKTGWRAMNLKFKALPDARLGQADRYVARMMMDAMLAPLENPARSVMVSIFTPCELMQEAGLSPYNVEGFSCYVTASEAGRACADEAESQGIADTLCSYHRTFIGAAETGLLPPPRCIVYTNVSCDANLLTFRRLARLFDVPSYFIDVPAVKDASSVAYVARQLRGLASFLEAEAGRRIDEDALRARVRRASDTACAYDLAQRLLADRQLSVDLVSPFYCAMANNILLGTPEAARYASLLLDDAQAASEKRGKHLYWMHTVPYRSAAVQDALMFSDRAQIACCELAQAYDLDFWRDDPYEAMARRMVFNHFNGAADARIRAGVAHARAARADGAVWFNQWGCKHTIGASILAKRAFAEAGIPLLVLDGDGLGASAEGEGQTATRLGAFLEMIGA